LRRTKPAGSVEREVQPLTKERHNCGGSAWPLLTNVYLHYRFDLCRSTGVRQKSTTTLLSFAGLMAESFYRGFEIERKTVLVEMLFVKI
jgi:hypothetical protein